METKSCQKVAAGFSCITCDYYTIRKSSYDKHLTTLKHYKLTEANKKIAKSCAHDNDTIFSCDFCDKNFRSRVGLWKHKKKCYEDPQTNSSNDKELIMMLIKENSEFKNMIIKVLENGTHNTNNSHNTTNNNNFNLNFYLNETCKNAMNITDFISQLNVGIKDLEETGRLGFSEGISKIFINGLKQIDVTDRPIHCSDSKRETLYIKDSDEWVKDNDDKSILTNAIKTVAHKNIKKISEWQKLYPEFNDPSSKQNDKYLKIICESMSGGSKEETDKNYNKIVKNIVKETIIDKDVV
jgi:hypothetical protein